MCGLTKVGQENQTMLLNRLFRASLMTNILRDKQSKFVMMWLVCMISLALCLHFNEHVTVNEFQRHVSIDAIHSHHHEISQQHSHSHQDNYYEHFVGYDALKSTALAHLLKGYRF